MSSSTSTSNKAKLSDRFGLFSVLAAITVLAIAIAFIETRATDLIKIISPFRYQILLAERAAPRIEAIALGDSHTGMGFWSEDPRFQNVGFAGETIAEITVKARYLIKKLPHLKVVFLQAQPHLFFKHRFRDDRPPYKYLSEGRGVFHPFERTLLQFDPCCRGDMLSTEIKSLLNKNPKPEPTIDDNGYLDYSRPEKMPQTRLEQAQVEVKGYGSVEVVPEILKQYDELVELLKSHGIKIILTHYPLSPEYRSTLPKSAFETLDSYFHDIQNKQQTSVCGSWDALGGIEDFFNSDHLSKDGAVKYWQTLRACAKANLLLSP